MHASHSPNVLERTRGRHSLVPRPPPQPTGLSLGFTVGPQNAGGAYANSTHAIAPPRSGFAELFVVCERLSARILSLSKHEQGLGGLYPRCRTKSSLATPRSGGQTKSGQKVAKPPPARSKQAKTTLRRALRSRTSGRHLDDALSSEIAPGPSRLGCRPGVLRRRSSE